MIVVPIAEPAPVMQQVLVDISHSPYARSSKLLSMYVSDLLAKKMLDSSMPLLVAVTQQDDEISHAAATVA